MPNLTYKQKIFIAEYLKSWNATGAARNAGYKGSKETLASVGYENLRKPHIRAIIDAELETRMLDADRVLFILSTMAAGVDLTEYFNKEYLYGTDQNGEKYLKPIILDFNFEKIREDGKSGLIKSIKQNSSGHIQIEFYDRLAALDKLAKYHQLYTRKVDVKSHSVGLGENLLAAIEMVYGQVEDE